LSEEGDLETAMLRLGAPPKKEKGGFAGDLNVVVESMKRVPWTALADLKKDPEILKKIDEATALLQSLRNTLTVVTVNLSSAQTIPASPYDFSHNCWACPPLTRKDRALLLTLRAPASRKLRRVAALRASIPSIIRSLRSSALVDRQPGMSIFGYEQLQPGQATQGRLIGFRCWRVS